MERLNRRHFRVVKGKREYYERDYIIYSREEADKEGIKLRPWYKCRKGDWGESDDGFVSECLKRRQYKDHKGTLAYNLVFPFGQAFYRPKSNPGGKLSYLEHKRTGNFASVSPKYWSDLEKRRFRTKNFVRAYVIQFVGGVLDYDQLGKIYAPMDKNPIAKAKYLLKKEFIQEMIDVELKKHLTNRDIDEGTVLDMIMEAYSLAKSKEDRSNMLRAAENFRDILGMRNKQENTQGFELEAVQLSNIEEQMGISGGNGRAKELKS